MEQSLPDYSTYSLFDLRDAYARVSRATFPERTRALRAEIERRRVEPSATSGASRCATSSRSLYGVAGFLLLTGTFGMALLWHLLDAWALGEVRRLGPFFIVNGLSLAAGWLLFKQHRMGLWLAAAALFPQLIQAQVLDFTYACQHLGWLVVKVWTGFLSLEAGFGAAFYQIGLVGGAGPSYVGLNLVVAVAFAFVVQALLDGR